MAWFYLSFASQTTFLGACVVEASDSLEAVDVATSRKLNPGGEVMAIRAPGDTPGPFPPYRLMTRAEIDEYDGGSSETTGELSDRGIEPGPNVSMLHEECNAARRRGAN